MAETDDPQRDQDQEQQDQKEQPRATPPQARDEPRGSPALDEEVRVFSNEWEGAKLAKIVNVQSPICADLVYDDGTTRESVRLVGPDDEKPPHPAQSFLYARRR